MNIIKGELDFLYKPAASKSRPGSHMSDLSYEGKPRIKSATGSLEVLTPDLSSQDWEMDIYLSDGHGTPEEDNAEDHDGEIMTRKMDCTQSFAEKSSKNTTSRTELTAPPRSPKEKTDNKRSSPRSCRESGAPSASPSSPLVGDPSLEEDIKQESIDKAIEKMKSLDEILQKKTAKEKEVKAKGQELRKRLWEELQSVTKETSLQSNEELINTSKFLALTPQINEVEGETNIEMDKVYESVFSTQLPSDDYEFSKIVQGDVSGNESDSLPNASAHHLTDERKAESHKKGTDFIKRNIELAKEAGSSFLMTKDEQLRLEELLADIDTDCNEEDLSGNMSICHIPGEGFTPDSEECTQLAHIEADLQKFQDNSSISETDDHEFTVTKKGNMEPTLGERLLNDAKMLRNKKLRLRDIDQQIKEIEESLLNLSALSTESSLCFE